MGLLFKVLHDDIGYRFIRLVVPVDDQVVVSRAIAGGACKLLDVVLALLIHLVDGLLGQQFSYGTSAGA